MESSGRTLMPCRPDGGSLLDSTTISKGWGISISRSPPPEGPARLPSAARGSPRIAWQLFVRHLAPAPWEAACTNAAATNFLHLFRPRHAPSPIRANAAQSGWSARKRCSFEESRTLANFMLY